jgi:hypothetical protein
MKSLTKFKKAFNNELFRVIIKQPSSKVITCTLIIQEGSLVFTKYFGKSICNDEDIFDLNLGISIAFDRALNNYYYAKDSKLQKAFKELNKSVFELEDNTERLNYAFSVKLKKYFRKVK